MRYTLLTAVVAALAVMTSAAAGPLMYRPEREYGSISGDIYELTVQKDGRANVTLVGGEPVFTNAFPMVLLEGDAKPEPLDLDGRKSARIALNDPLGRGNGMVFKKGNCEWHVRTYLTRPFLAVQVVFTNTKHKPVKVKMLMPWCVGDPARGVVSLGPGTDRTVILENGDVFHNADARQRLRVGESLSYWHSACYNAATGRSLVAGFLTQDLARTEIYIRRSEEAKPTEFDVFRAVSVFEPPVEVASGGTLASEVLYLSVAAASPFEGLEEYGRAIAALNKGKGAERYLPLKYAAPHSVPAVAEWGKTEGKPSGCVELLTDAIGHYYLWPILRGNAPERPAVEDVSAITWNQTVCWVTGRALTGGMLPLPKPDPTTQGPLAAVLRKLSPQLGEPARPADLFETEQPRVWALRFRRPSGEWNIVAVFNWNSEPEEVPLYVTRLGLDPTGYYTVYDFWRDVYYGTAQGKIALAVPPGSVCLLGVRPYEPHPMLLSVDWAFTQGAMELETLEWDSTRKQIRGAFDGEPDTDYGLRVLVPDPYAFVAVSALPNETRAELHGNVLRIAIHCVQPGAVTWVAEFASEK